MRNVVLVTIDSLRADHCGFMGYDRDTTPTLDRMAREGYTFENAIAPGPSTYDSMPAVFTGRHMVPFSSGGETNTDALDRRTRQIRLNMRGETIPEWFERKGYATAAFTTNPYTSTGTDFARGFNRYEDFMGDGEGMLMRKAAHLPVVSELKHIVTLLQGDRASKPWTDYYDQIVSWVDRAEEPYFLWVFLLDPHTPYLSDEEYRSEVGALGMYYHNWKLWVAKKWRNGAVDLNRDKLLSLYDSSIRFVDEFLRQLWEDLNDTDPAMLVHADHGEAFGEHGTYGHQSYLYEENIHVPLVLFNAASQGSEAQPTSLTQVPRLLRSAAREYEVSSNQPFALARTRNGRLVAVRGADWKYIGRFNENNAIVEEESYNLTTDPQEQQNMVEDRTDLAAICRQVLVRRSRHEAELDRLDAGISEMIGKDQETRA